MRTFAAILRAMREIGSRLLWLVTGGGAVLAAANFLGTYWGKALSGGRGQEISAPQLAALAAESLVYAIVPYVLARAWDKALRDWPNVETDDRTDHRQAA